MQGKIATGLFILFAGLLSCNEEALEKRSGRHFQSDGNGADEGDGLKNGNRKGDQNGVRVITDAGFSLSLVSAHQLGRRIDECVGNSNRIINEAQILGSRQADDSAFLLANVYKAGEDVIEKLQPLIDGDEQLQRAGIRPGIPSIRYFSNVQEIARIVGDNCDRIIRAGNDDEAVSRCSCKTPALAQAMFERCLSAFSSTEPDAKEALFHFTSQCNTNARRAIASMIASFAFTMQH